MWDPIVRSRLEALPRLLEAFLDATRRGWTPLMQAVVEGDEARVAALLAGGADVDAIAEGPACALTLACDAGAARLVTRLLEAGADACARAHRDRSALHLAARHGSTALVQRLVDTGARMTSDADGPRGASSSCRRATSAPSSSDDVRSSSCVGLPRGDRRVTSFARWRTHGSTQQGVPHAET